MFHLDNRVYFLSSDNFKMDGFMKFLFFLVLMLSFFGDRLSASDSNRGKAMQFLMENIKSPLQTSEIRALQNDLSYDLDMTINLSPQILRADAIEAKTTDSWTKKITEEGICYSTNHRNLYC